MITTIFVIVFLLSFTYLTIKIVIFTKTQKNKICRVCNSNSHDTERVSRNNFIKKVFLPKNVHKYWCRKCGNNFYYKQINN
jgi:hypothetical protein